MYDPDRLEELKQRKDHADIAYVAAALLDREEMGGIEEQLSREARRTKPDLERCQGLLADLANLPASDLDVGPLKSAHFALNGRAPFYPIRAQIVTAIARAPYSIAKINALSEVLIGPGSGVQDPPQRGPSACNERAVPASVGRGSHGAWLNPPCGQARPCQRLARSRLQNGVR